MFRHFDNRPAKDRFMEVVKGAVDIKTKFMYKYLTGMHCCPIVQYIKYQALGVATL